MKWPMSSEQTPWTDADRCQWHQWLPEPQPNNYTAGWLVCGSCGNVFQCEPIDVYISRRKLRKYFDADPKAADPSGAT